MSLVAAYATSGPGIAEGARRQRVGAYRLTLTTSVLSMMRSRSLNSSQKRSRYLADIADSVRKGSLWEDCASLRLPMRDWQVLVLL
eukprot:266059-Rhodomonas_salina.1